jgi:hypothetical protein
MLKFGVSACRIFRPNSGRPPKALFTPVPTRKLSEKGARDAPGVDWAVHGGQNGPKKRRFGGP